MRVKFVFLIACILNLLFAASGKELFHFNFKECNGKSILKSGGYTLSSARVPLLGQQGALRIAPTAEITISGDLGSLHKAFTVSGWILNKRDIDLSPILSRGAWGKEQQFVFTAGPELYTRQGKWNTTGLRNGNKLAISGTWKHIAGTFDSGMWKLYVDGKLYAQKKSALTQLPVQTEPLILGAQKDAFKRMNFANADMLLNDLHLFDHAMSDSEIAALYLKERPAYPAGSLIPAGKTVRHALENCFHYAKDGYDPDFKKELNITRNWKNSSPAAPVVRAEVKKTSSTEPAKLLINGKEELPYMTFLSAFINHDRYELPQISGAARDFGAAGVKLMRFATQVWHPYMGTVWKGPGKYDFSIPERQLKTLLAGHPGALVEICISLNEAPPWFVKQYKNSELEQCMLPNGKLRPAMAGGEIGSDVWKAMTEQYVHDFITHMENSPYADRIFGYTVCGGRSHEWYWPGTFTSGVPGYSKATAALYASWRKANNLPPAPVPTPAERQFSETLMLRDPQKAASVIEFRRFLNDRTYNCLRDLVITARKALKKPKLIGTYSGYSFNNEVKNHIGGLNIFSKVARLPECDYVQLAVVYGEQRMPGNAGLSVNPYNGSAMLHGKLFWFESDMRTALVPNLNEKERENRFDTVQESAAALERNCAVAFTRGSGIYEMTLNGLATYHHDTIMQAIQNNVRNAGNFLKSSRHSAAQAAVFYDEHSALYHAWPNRQNQNFFRALLQNFYYNHPKAGFPMDFYTLADIHEKDLKDYKLYIFLNTIAPDEKTVRQIRQKADRNGATVLWCYAPGFIANGKFDAANMEKVTGISFDVSMKGSNVSARTVPGSKLFRSSRKLPFIHCQPLFTPTGPGLTVHAAAGKKAVVVEKKVSGHRAIYTLIPPDTEFLRDLAASAGVHIYLESPDVLSADSEHIFIHSAASGRKKVSLPGKYDILDVSGGKLLFRNTDSFTVEMKQYENKLYQIRKKEVEK